MENSENENMYVMRTGFVVPDWLNKTIEEAKMDPELLICLRGNQIHIYYEGGKILDLKKNTKDVSISFDMKYLNIENNEITTEYEWLQNSKTIRNTLRENPHIFFAAAKKVMCAWFKEHIKQEREHQHKITTNNASASNEGDLAVVDIEYAVSTYSHCYNKAYKDTFRNYTRYPSPRFDIIAIDKHGQIYVLELKTGVDSTENAEKHITDFVAMIGSHRQTHSGVPKYKVFLEEISAMIKVLNDNHFRTDNLTLPDVNLDKPPIFGFIFTVKKNPKTKGHTPEYQKERIQKIIDKAIEKAIASSSKQALGNYVKEMVDEGVILDKVLLVGDDFKLKL